MLKITTNNQPRDLLTLWDFSDKERIRIRSDFDWLDDIESDSGFFRYKGFIYHLSEFLHAACTPLGWDGYQADSWFSGTLIRLSDDGETVTVGRWVS